jgi:nicotinamidase-related amidase
MVLQLLKYNDSYALHSAFATLRRLSDSDKERDYYIQRRKFAMARTALFVIDIQVELAQNATTEIPHAERIRGAGTRVLQRARQAIDSASEHGVVPDLEIVFVQHEEVAEKGPLVKGSKPWELVFKPRDNNRWERLVSKDIRE